MAPVELKSPLINIKISEMPSCCCTEIGLMSALGLPGDRALRFRSLWPPLTFKPWHFSCSHFSILSSHYHSRFCKATLTSYDSWLDKHWLFIPKSPKAQSNQILFYCNFIPFVCYGLLMSSADRWWMEHSRGTMCLPKVIQSCRDYNNPDIITMRCDARYSTPCVLNGSLP